MSSANVDYRTNPWRRTPEPLLWLASCGRERVSAGYYFNSARRSDRPHACLQLTLAGKGFYDNGKTRAVLPTGVAWFDVIPGPFEYGIDPTSDQPHELVFIALAGPVAMEWQERIAGTFGRVLDLGANRDVQTLMLTIAHAWQAGTLPDRYLQSAQLYQLLMTIYSTLTNSRLSTTPHVKRALQLIGDHAGDVDFTVTQLAQRMDCSREHLARQFMAAMGVSPNHYLTQHRLRLAAGALRDSDDKLDLVARRCGFANANYLVRTFRKHVGTTPAKFRKQPWMAGPW